MDTSSDERIVENLRLEDLPEIIASRVDDDEEMEDSPEPERSMEEILQELVTNILNRTSTTAVKAMKEVEQHVSSGMYIEELLECADQLVYHTGFCILGHTRKHTIKFFFFCRWIRNTVFALFKKKQGNLGSVDLSV